MVVRDINSMVDINRLSIEEQSIVEVLKEELDKIQEEDDIDNVIATIERDKVKAKVTRSCVIWHQLHVRIS